MADQNTIAWHRDDDGIVVLTMDDPNQSANTMNSRFIESMRATVDRLEAERESITGVVLTSAKKTFFAGGDLNDILKARREDAPELFEDMERTKGDLRRLERLGVPVVAAINGTALGGGLELALACHHRIVSDAKGVELGLPEVTLGVLPGGGGVVRTVRMFGIQAALLKVLLTGQRHDSESAREIGLVDAVVPADALLESAKDWIRSNPDDCVQPWDAKGYRMPGGTPATPSLGAHLTAMPAVLRKQLNGANLPAPRAIMAAAVEGAQVDVDTALTIESRYFLELMTSQVAKNMMQAFFFDMQAIKAGTSRPQDHPKRAVEKVVVLGAGMMGAGIAYSCARAGIQVVLKDVSLDAAEKGKAYSANLVGKAVARGRLDQENGDELLARIVPTDDVNDAAGADLVIEAVFEDPAVKASVFAEIEPVVAADAVLGSNTSTLPITSLAREVSRPEDFIGLHFFSPVDKMHLLEIVVGEKTSDATLARAFDFAVQLRKTPIVVNDGRGFFTSRVIGTFIDEAVAMVGEGLNPASIEQAGLQAGYPAAPLQLLDELNFALTRRIREQYQAAAIADGHEWVEPPAQATINRMIDEFARQGRAAGGGFYEYVDGKRVRLWPGLTEHFAKAGHEIPFEDMKERMLFAEAIEAVHCLDDGVLRSVADANVGSLIGIGFPAWTGGVLQYVNGYPGGPAGFVTRARELAERYGPRFEPPASLVSLAERGETYR